MSCIGKYVKLVYGRCGYQDQFLKYLTWGCVLCLVPINCLTLLFDVNDYSILWQVKNAELQIRRVN